MDLSWQLILLKECIGEYIHMIEVVQEIYVDLYIPFPISPKLIIHITLISSIIGNLSGKKSGTFFKFGGLLF
jgi:hypothetical protein